MIRAIIVLWAQRLLHPGRAQQGDLSVFQEAQPYPTAQHVKHPSTAKKLPSMKNRVRQAPMATEQALRQVDALDTVHQASFVPHRQINLNGVLLEHSVCWAMLHALAVLLGTSRNQKHQRGATNVRQERTRLFSGQHSAVLVL